MQGAGVAATDYQTRTLLKTGGLFVAYSIACLENALVEGGQKLHIGVGFGHLL